MELDALIRRACATDAGLDEGTQQRLLSLALAAGTSPQALTVRADAAPAVLARIVDTLGGRSSDDAVRAAVLHPSCPLDAVAAFAAIPGGPPPWLADRDVLPDGIADVLVEAAEGERTIGRMLTRSWLTSEHARTLVARLAGLHHDRFNPDLDTIETSTLDGLRAVATRYPRALSQVCLDRIRAGAPVGGTELVLTTSAIGTLAPDERAEVAAALFVDELEALPAGGHIAERLHGRLWCWQSQLLPDGPQRDAVAAAVERADLSDCGRRDWLLATFGTAPDAVDWLDGVDTNADLVALVARHGDRLPADTVIAMVGMGICDTLTAVTVACGQRGPRRRHAAAILAARAHDTAFVTTVVQRTPTLLATGAEVLGTTPGELALAALPGLLANRGPDHHLVLEAARREWGPHLAAHADDLDADGLAAMLGVDDLLDAAAVAALARLGDDELTAATAVTVAADWSGSLAGLADAVAALRPAQDPAA